MIQDQYKANKWICYHLNAVRNNELGSIPGIRPRRCKKFETTIINCVVCTSNTAVSIPVDFNLYRPYFWNSQSLLSRGHTWRVFNHLDMQ